MKQNENNATENIKAIQKEEFCSVWIEVSLAQNELLLNVDRLYLY